MRRLPTILATLAALGAGGCGAKPAPKAQPVDSAFVRTDASVRTGRAPVAVAVGAGAVWVANNADGTLTRVDPTTPRVQQKPIRVGVGPVAVAAGPTGVWVALATGAVVRVDPATDRVTGPSIPVPDPGGVAVGGGRVWVTSRSRNEVVAIDARAGRVLGRTPVGTGPTDVAVDASGVWVANSTAGTVTRVDPATRAADPPVRVARHQALNAGSPDAAAPAGGAEVLALTVGEGGVWVAKTDSPLAATIQVRKLDPKTRALTGSAIDVRGGIPIHLAAGGGGVWVTDVGTTRPGEPARRPGLLRIDPGTARVTGAPIALGTNPAGVAVGATGVWVANTGDNTLRRIGAGTR